MATRALGTNLTLAELVRREDPDGTLADIVDVISEQNDIIADAQWMECNNGTMHEATRKASEPAGAFRAYNMGVPPEAGVTEKVIEPTAMLDGFSEVDDAEYRHQPGGIPAARAQEDEMFFSGLSKTFVSTLFDGNRASNPLSVTGINNRADYNALSSNQVFDNAGGNASATANKTSMYLIQWGPKMVQLIHPRNDPNAGTNTGVKMRDFDLQMVTSTAASGVTNAKLPMWQTWFEVHFGIFISDPRMLFRLVNISTSNIDGVDDFSIDENVMIDIGAQLRNNGNGAIWYANRTLMAQIQKRANDKGNANFIQEAGEGPFARPVFTFNGIPIHLVEQITDVQATVS